MSFSIQQDQDQIRGAWRFQTHADLGCLRMKDCKAWSADAEARPEGELRLGVGYEVKRTDAPVGTVRIEVAFRFAAEAASNPEQKLFEIHCGFQLDYKLVPDYTPTDEDVAAFQGGNAVFHCWPHAREFVQSAAMRMGLSVPPLPLLRLVPKKPQVVVVKKKAVARKRPPASAEATQ